MTAKLVPDPLLKYQNCGGETGPRLFTEKSKLNISLDQLSKVSYSLFLLYFRVQSYILKIRLRPLTFT